MDMVYRKLACIAATVLSAAGLLGPAQAGGLHEHAGFHGGIARGPAIAGRPVFAKSPFAEYRSFEGPFFGISAFYAYGPPYASCWIRLPTHLGWRRVWVCNWPYGLGYVYD
jgi:hypothetical protein